MIKLIFLALFALSVSSAAFAHSDKCERWEYASLSFTVKAIIEESEHKSTYTFVIWEEPNGNGVWQNGESQYGTFDKSLVEHFEIKSINAPGILNAIGAQGWEAFGFYVTQGSEELKTNQWQFKKCSE